MSSRTNAQIWNEWGVSEEGIADCDAIMPLMLEAVRRAGPELAKVVLEEAVFQTCELPRRTSSFQEQRAWRSAEGAKR